VAVWLLFQFSWWLLALAGRRIALGGPKTRYAAP